MPRPSRFATRPRSGNRCRPVQVSGAQRGSRRPQMVQGSNYPAHVIDDLSFGADITAQTVGTLQPAAHLIDRLTWAYAKAARELVVIQRATGVPKLLQDARSDRQASHGRMIPHHVLVWK